MPIELVLRGIVLGEVGLALLSILKEVHGRG